VVDVPGSHFNLLRQFDADMSLMITQLKLRLAPFGWMPDKGRTSIGGSRKGVESLQMAGGPEYIKPKHSPTKLLPPPTPPRLPALRPIPSASNLDSSSATSSGTSTNGDDTESISFFTWESNDSVMPLNASAAEIGENASPTPPPHHLPALIICCDANGSVGGLEAMFAGFKMPCYAVRTPPPFAHEEDILDADNVSDLAAMCLKSVKKYITSHSGGNGSQRFLAAGVGFGSVIAQELALLLESDDQVDGEEKSGNNNNGAFKAFIFDNLHTIHPTQSPEEEVCQLVTIMWPLLMHGADKAGLTAEAIVANLVTIGNLGNFDEQLEYLDTFRLPDEEDEEGGGGGGGGGASKIFWDYKVYCLLLRLTYYKALWKSSKKIVGKDDDDGVTSRNATEEEILATLAPLSLGEP